MTLSVTCKDLCYYTSALWYSFHKVVKVMVQIIEFTTMGHWHKRWVYTHACEFAKGLIDF